ncbi:MULTISPECIES: WecB/TagA/CpsF family glycosyltransferase [Calothrix]|uniref:WecB/TagA/CpsF family glycosyltransferase n=2 Tax=Calothrix TaxID=1186 RepID=A0ABR8ABK9_9CYAN|nr:MULTISPECIES: WecB/TagA/CpsF family glycosyltransferase [Calothrix]MBD2197357.1 WecB/TagA/CpsF family glycosyltransferase [Calothrix parietina FACHB-288]MBD2228185.1 WecB/TagA/CpsF family glycosyltransferase [Calothrix anomala FACHB-343]
MTLHNYPEITVLNTRFHQLTVQDLIKYIVKSGGIEQKTIIGNVNVRAINFSYQLPWYRNFINNADLVFCDGIGVILGARILGYKMESRHRMTCPDYIESLALACEQDNVSLFLLAGKPGVTDKAIKKLLEIAPNLRIAGHHGYFNKSGSENDVVIEKINKFKPDVLYIGFGMPLQEKWILDNFNKIETRVFLPLGACLDFYTDSVYRGPRWLTDNGFEWLTRLITEPTRLWERYIVGNPLFFYRIFKQRINQGFIANHSDEF